MTQTANQTGPEHSEERRINLHKAARLLQHPALLLVDANFIEEALLDTGGRISPAQQARFDEICAKYGVNGNDAEN